MLPQRLLLPLCYRLLPLIIVLVLIVPLAIKLVNRPPSQPAITAHPLPQFQLADIAHPGQLFTHKQLKGHLSLLNVWATWCESCQLEHAMLMQIKSKYPIPLYGIAYKDTLAAVQQWIKQAGNPYRRLGIDATGDLAIDLGLYGTPETFLINAQGQIIYHQIGMITQSVWDNILHPLINQYQS